MSELMVDLVDPSARDAPRTGLGGLAPGATELVLPPGVPFIEEGRPVDEPWVIVSGAALLSRLTLDGKRHVLSLLGPGDIVGISPGPVNDCTVEPVVETRLRQLDDGIGSQRERTQRIVIRQLARQLEAARTHAVRLQRRSAEEKLASLILALPPAGQHGGILHNGTNGCDRIMLSLVDVADYLSLRMETVCRVLSRFRRKGVITMPARGLLSIVDEDALARIANPTD